MCVPLTSIYLLPLPLRFYICSVSKTSLKIKKKKDEGGCNLLPSVKMRYGPQAPAKLLISPQFGPGYWEARSFCLGQKWICWTTFPLVDVGQVTEKLTLSVCMRQMGLTRRFPLLSLASPWGSEVLRGQQACGLSVLWLVWQVISCIFQMKNVISIKHVHKSYIVATTNIFIYPE